MAVAFMMIIKELRRNGGETAENRHLPPNFFCHFAELDILESFQAIFFFKKKKLVSNDSELSNSARKKNAAVDGGFRR